MRYQIRLSIIICLSLLLLPTLAQAQVLIAEPMTLSHDGIERQYYQHVPTGEIGSAMIVLHPRGSNGRAMQLVTGLNAHADVNGFVVAYPDSAVPYWDDGRVQAGLIPDEGSVDDVGFLVALADQLRSEFGVTDVTLAGFENGGGMALRVACEAPSAFETIIAVAMMMWEYHAEQCPETPEAPVDLFFITGAEHPRYIAEGEDIQYLATGATFSWFGWQKTVDFWRERYRCADSSVQVTDDALTHYDECDDGTIVRFWAIPIAGYSWPRMAANQLNRFGVDVSDVIAAYISDDDWEALTQPTNQRTSLARSWVLYVPASYDANMPTPLVVNLHGRLSNAPSQAYTSDFNSVAEREGFIVLYPNGIDTEWNYLLGLFDVTPDAHSDEAFLRTLIADLGQDLNFDSQRMYVTGLSNGGFMTQRLACTMQDQFAAFVSVAATAPFGINDLCDEADPVPMMYIHGTQDTIVRWTGNIVEDGGGTSFYISYPMEESFNFWGLHNDCTGEHSNETLPIVDPETQTEILTLVNCAPNATVTLMIVNGGGHVWPGTRTVEYDLLGQNSQDFNASERIWSFFSQYTLDGTSTTP